ncbi:MAG: cytochrome c oxidase accessory protein CcoG [Alphaproteobacteria bacterium]|nr:cytochrome c oxidase accessory protein CcoG [Alphaproteobacteria bacterium]MCD8570896.1 cytochrome c oxidase accessory protein CcoG [Alphaproteobacteria bacterium]
MDSTQNQNSNQQSNQSLLGYFAKQEKIFPKRVWGKYRKLKWVAMIVTLGIYYLVPFIRWDRGPNAPDQAVLIDLNGPRAYWFWIEIWPQEIYIFTGILILAAIALFFVTSMFGRVWCGYFCPQTVWTDLFVWVERFVQGDRNARKKLYEGPWTFEKICKIGLTHFIWLIIAWCTAGSFVLYFNDAPTLVWSFFEFDVSPTVLTVIAGLTFSTYLMAGFAREQVCTYMCPYARFQSAMFDKDTLIIGYDLDRGEPRGKHKKGESWDGRGDCIDCTACVQVCPMGIDIRNGLQMECIACGLCVDACNNIMDQVERPRGLIRYDTTNHMAAAVKGGAEKFKFFRIRTFYYSAILALVGSVMLYALITRAPAELHILHDRNPLYVQLSSGEIRNGYTVKILNKTHDHKTYMISVEGLDGAVIDVSAAGDVGADNLFVPADSVGSYHINLHAHVPPDEPRDIKFILEDREKTIRTDYDAKFITKRK